MNWRASHSGLTAACVACGRRTGEPVKRGWEEQAAFYAPENQAAAGIDFLGELRAILDAAGAAKEGAPPVPAALVAFDRGGPGGAQAIMKVQPGFLDRLAARLASKEPPAWKGNVEKEEDTAEAAFADCDICLMKERLL